MTALTIGIVIEFMVGFYQSAGSSIYTSSSHLGFKWALLTSTNTTLRRLPSLLLVAAFLVYCLPKFVWKRWRRTRYQNNRMEEGIGRKRA